MKHLVATLLLLLGARVLGEEPPEDGFYRGEELVRLRPSAVWLVSEDNANYRFALHVEIPYDQTLGSDSYVLAVKGARHRQHGSGSSGKETSSLHFYIAGEDAAKVVGNFLGVAPRRRTHPGHRLGVAFVPAKEAFAPGEDVTVKLRIVNVGQDPVAFMRGGRYRGARDNQYLFSAYRGGKQVEDIGDSNHMGGLASKVVLRPGEAFEASVSLSKWFAFKEPGAYLVHGAYYLAFVEQDSRSFRRTWEDYAAADFEVIVKAP